MLISGPLEHAEIDPCTKACLHSPSRPWMFQYLSRCITNAGTSRLCFITHTSCAHAHAQETVRTYQFALSTYPIACFSYCMSKPTIFSSCTPVHICIQAAIALHRQVHTEHEAMRDNLAVQHLAETVKTASLVQQWRQRSAQVRPSPVSSYPSLLSCLVTCVLPFTLSCF